MARQDTYVRYTIRLPAPLYERVREAAGEKSINAEIIARLETSFGVVGLGEAAAKPKRDDTAALRRDIQELAKKLDSALRSLEKKK